MKRQHADLASVPTKRTTRRTAADGSAAACNGIHSMDEPLKPRPLEANDEVMLICHYGRRNPAGLRRYQKACIPKSYLGLADMGFEVARAADNGPSDWTSFMPLTFRASDKNAAKVTVLSATDDLASLQLPKSFFRLPLASREAARLVKLRFRGKRLHSAYSDDWVRGEARYIYDDDLRSQVADTYEMPGRVLAVPLVGPDYAGVMRHQVCLLLEQTKDVCWRWATSSDDGRGEMQAKPNDVDPSGWEAFDVIVL